MSTELANVQTAVAEFDKVAAGLAALKDKYAGIVYEIQHSKGMEAAKSARADIREPRYEIERVRKSAKEPILALGRELDKRAKEITAEILKLEEPIDEQIKNEEQRKEREKQAKIDAEVKRVEILQERVAELRGHSTPIHAGYDPVRIAEHIAELESIPVDDSFAEYRKQAEDAKAAALARLRDLQAAATARVAENARIKAEREELAKLRAEQAEREAASRAKIAEEERIAKLARDAELAEQRRLQAITDAEIKAKRQAEQEELQAMRKAQEIIAANLAAERAEIDRQKEVAARTLAKEQQELKERQRLASIKRPSDDEMVAVLAQHYQVTEYMVHDWLVDFGA